MPSAADAPASMSHRLAITIGLFVVAVIVAVSAMRNLPTTIVAGTDATRTASPSARDDSRQRTDPAQRGGQARPASRAVTVIPTSFVPSEVATATVVRSAGNLMAITPQDKAWLAKHGYPTLVEREWSKQASFDELAAAARTGPVFAALYGERLWEGDRYREGKAVLLDALARGALYAAESIAVRTLHDGQRADGTNGAVFEAAAWWLYAAQMGNYHASDAMTNRLSGLGVDKLGPALTRAFEIAQEVDAARASMGLPPAVRDVRPSFGEYLENRNRPEVTVVPR